MTGKITADVNDTSVRIANCRPRGHNQWRSLGNFQAPQEKLRYEYQHLSANDNFMARGNNRMYLQLLLLLRHTSFQDVHNTQIFSKKSG